LNAKAKSKGLGVEATPSIASHPHPIPSDPSIYSIHPSIAIENHPSIERFVSCVIVIALRLRHLPKMF